MREQEIHKDESKFIRYTADMRPVERASFDFLDQDALRKYIEKLKDNDPNLAHLEDERIYELMKITLDGKLTLSSVLLFSRFPQAYFPQLAITAIAVPGTEIGAFGKYEERFIDNKRIEGTIVEMLDDAIRFVRRNMRTKTIIDPKTVKREDRTDYPLIAIREALINALVHRDYSIDTEGTPIQIAMYEDRMEIINPSRPYWEPRKEQQTIRNPVLASALEVLGTLENNQTGIPAIKKAMKEQHLREPEFMDENGTFSVTFYR